MMMFALPKQVCGEGFFDHFMEFCIIPPFCLFCILTCQRAHEHAEPAAPRFCTQRPRFASVLGRNEDFLMASKTLGSSPHCPPSQRTSMLSSSLVVLVSLSLSGSPSHQTIVDGIAKIVMLVR